MKPNNNKHLHDQAFHVLSHLLVLCIRVKSSLGSVCLSWRWDPSWQWYSVSSVATRCIVSNKMN